MKFLNNIKFNYNSKLLEDLLLNKKYQEALEIVSSIKAKDTSLYFDILFFLNKTLTDISHSKFYKSKIAWIISFDQDDAFYLNNFLDFYLSKQENISSKQDNYAGLLSRTIESLNLDNKFPNEIKFEENVKFSNLFQNLILFDSDEELLILNKCAAFFEAYEKNYLIYPNTTLCYFYVHQDPSYLYSKYKKKLGTSEAALDEIFNFTKSLYFNDSSNPSRFKVYENRNSWNTNVSSWTDQNVMSTFKGKIFSYDQFVSDTEETLIESIYHLKQHGLDIDVKYELVSEFIKLNPVEHKEPLALSNNERKILNNNIDTKIIENLEYSN
jgi:hypothetical protein